MGKVQGIVGVGIFCLCAGCATQHEPAMQQRAAASVAQGEFGNSPEGAKVTAYKLTNAQGLKAVLIDYGAILVSLETPDRKGNLADVVLGCDTVEGYATVSPYFGAIVGRYANRIALGRFTLDGVPYTLATNNAPNHLHGGKIGFNKVMWQGRPFSDVQGAGVVFTYRSPDMEEGYPGNLDCTVTYTLTNENELQIEYQGTTDKPTVVNLSHHSYFNLKGHGSGDVLGHVMTINADRYTPVDTTLIPTGQIATVAATPLDFTHPAAIGAQIAVIGGYDHNFVLNKRGDNLSLAARVAEPDSGRVMEVYTTEPGLQFYTGNFLDGSFKGKGGAVYEKHAGFCLEAQHYPDSPNRPQFPSTVLRPGEKYHQRTTYKISVE
ncbi:MAG: galactose mutarotase [Candidatus Hydrogenedentes bacterium]|nr:galactose mutarotase [Candidatus Hydrogenedentota bacterium]